MIQSIIYLLEKAQSPAIARYIYKIRKDLSMVKNSHEKNENFLRSTRSGNKALLFYIGSEMNQNKTSYYNK